MSPLPSKSAANFQEFYAEDNPETMKLFLKTFGHIIGGTVYELIKHVVPEIIRSYLNEPPDSKKKRKSSRLQQLVLTLIYRPNAKCKMALGISGNLVDRMIQIREKVQAFQFQQPDIWGRNDGSITNYKCLHRCQDKEWINFIMDIFMELLAYMRNNFVHTTAFLNYLLKSIFTRHSDLLFPQNYLISKELHYKMQNLQNSFFIISKTRRVSEFINMLIKLRVP